MDSAQKRTKCCAKYNLLISKNSLYPWPLNWLGVAIYLTNCCVLEAVLVHLASNRNKNKATK